MGSSAILSHAACCTNATLTMIVTISTGNITNYTARLPAD